MGSKWRKAKLTLGMNLCAYVPRTLGTDDSPPPSDRLSDAALLQTALSLPTLTMPIPSSHGLMLSKRLSRSSKKTKHSNRMCPVCRAKWNEIPMQNGPTPDSLPEKARICPLDLPPNNPDAIQFFIGATTYSKARAKSCLILDFLELRGEKKLHGRS